MGNGQRDWPRPLHNGSTALGGDMWAKSGIRSAGALAVALVATMSGCAEISVTTSSLDVPELHSYLPKDLLARDDLDVMLVAVATRQTEPFGKETQVVERPVFIKAKDFRSLDGRVKALREERVWLIGINIYTAFIPVPGPEISRTLESLCIATADGRALRLGMSAKKWSHARKDLIPAVRRDAIVASLRRNGPLAFTEDVGPCSLAGAIEWAATDRTKVIEFVQRMPDMPTGWADELLDPRLSRVEVKQIRHVPVQLDDFVNCVVKGERKWAYRPECD